MSERKIVKCVVWDLDGTIWDGILLENTVSKLKDNILAIIQELDNRGILQSIASKNEYCSAIQQLKKFNIDQYFLYPQIGWGPKSDSIRKIAESINIHIDSIAFIDDQEFELEEVSFSHSEVLCLNANCVNEILDMPEFRPLFITADSKMRRKMYQDDILRKKEEEQYKGAKDSFLKTLKMELTLSPAIESDLQRVEELTVRTHQLNSTGHTYSYDELKAMITSEHYLLYVAELEDKFGTYGKVGLMLVEEKPDMWILKLLLTSCRVVSRGVGSVMLTYLLQYTKSQGVPLLAEFVPTDRNRMMYIAYKLAGFHECGQNGSVVLLRYSSNNVPSLPPYIKIVLPTVF